MADKSKITTLALACAIAALAGAGASAQTAETPKRGGKLIVAQDESPDRIEPHGPVMTVQHKLAISATYEALLAIDNQFNVLPSLATSWVQESPTVFVFTLREGVKFHDGSDLTTEDVLFTFERILDPKRPGDAQNKLRVIKSVTAPDAKTIRIELQRPFAPFIRYMAVPEVTAIVGKKFALARNNDLTKEANGTGPYKITRFQPGIGITMERFADYWQKGVPNIDTVEIRIIPDDSTRLAALRTGEIDMTFFRPDKKRLIDTLRNVNTSPPIGNAMELIIFNCKVAPLDKLEVRQAIAMSVDTKAIATTVLPGTLSTLGMWVPSADKTYGYQGDGTDLPYAKPDPAKAKQMLAAAGFPNGIELKVQYINTAAFQIDQRITELMRDQVAKAGIKIVLEPVEYATFLQNYFTGKFQIGIGGRGMEVDPDGMFAAEAISTSRLSHCKDPKVDAYIDQERAETDPPKRAKIIDELQRYMVTQAYYIFPVNSPLRIEVWKQDIKGYVPHTLLRRLPLRHAWIDR